MKNAVAALAFVAALGLGSTASADEPSPPPPAPTEVAPPPPVAVEAPASAEQPPPVVRKKKFTGRQIAGAGLGAAGFLTLAVGSFFTISAMTLYDEAEGRCRRGTCERGDVKDAELARSQANAGGWIMLGGAALLGGGLALYFTAPKAEERTEEPPKALGIRPSLGGLSAFGTF